jgi:hypothetical protein
LQVVICRTEQIELDPERKLNENDRGRLVVRGLLVRSFRSQLQVGLACEQAANASVDASLQQQQASLRTSRRVHVETIEFD